jgi:hypothetical protein
LKVRAQVGAILALGETSPGPAAMNGILDQLRAEK